MFTEFKKIFSNKYIILFIVTAYVFIPYISNRFNSGQDYICHMANLYAMVDNISLSDGILFPSKIRSIIFNNLGYGNGIFYPQFSYYVTVYIYLFIKQLGFSLITAVKIFEFLIVFLSGVFMFKFVNTTFKNENAGLVAAIMYVTAPYFCVDVFKKMAYSEIGIFLFMPMILLAITYILNKDYKKFMIYFVIGYSGMICSHLVLTIYFTILLIIILLINIKKLLNKKTILYFALATVIVLGITSFEWVPMLEHKLTDNYWVFYGDSMYSLTGLEATRITLSNLLNPFNSNGSYPYITLWVLIFAILTIIFVKKILPNKEQRKILYSIEAFTLVAFLIGAFTDWENVPEFLKYIQFPSRIYTFITLGVSIIAGLGIILFKKYKKITILTIFVISIFCLANAINITHSVHVRILDNLTEEEISTSSSALGYQQEYLSIKAHENQEYLLSRSQDVLVVTGDAETEITENNTPYLQFSVNINDENTVTLELPRLYYLGYSITYENADDTAEKIEYYENDNGLIEIEVNKSGTITVEYTGTTLNKIADIVSVLTIILFIVFYIIIPFYNKRKLKLLE